MSGNFTQISGPGGRVQSLAPGGSTGTWIFNPASLKGTLPGGDYLYADRVRFRIVGQLTRNATVGTVPSPNWEALAQAFGQVRVYSQFLGEMVSKPANSVPILANHDSYFNNAFGANTRARGQFSATSGVVKAFEYEFAVDFKRGYLTRETDSCPWMPFLEGGIIELDLAPQTALNTYGWTMTGTWTCEAVIDWFPDKQPLIHAPVQSRLYRVITSGPEYLIKGIGAPNGLDGVVQGARLAILSWLGAGSSAGNYSGSSKDNGFYAAFGGTGGILFGTNGVTRLDVPFREQVSVDSVTSWISSFLAETRPTRFRNNIPDGQNTATAQTDMAGWPFAMDPALTVGQQSLVNDALDFWPLVWTGHYDKISDMQKVDGDLSFTVTLTTPGSVVLNLFRTDEVCGFTAAKVMDLMDRMGLPHVARGGAFNFVPKYAGGVRADDTTQWGLPLKIVRA